MMTPKLAALISLAVLSAGVVGSAGTYGATLTTIGDYLKNDLLDDESEASEDWKALQKKLNSSNDIHKYEDASLQAAQNQEKKDNPDDGKLVKEWCTKQKPHKVNPYFNLFNSKNLLAAVEEFCIETIADKLKDQKIDLKNGESEFKNKFDNLKNHSASSSGTEKVDLDKELNDMKNEDKEKSWTKLRDWCARTYKRGYNKRNNNLWKLSESYCKK